MFGICMVHVDWAFVWFEWLVLLLRLKQSSHYSQDAFNA